MSRKIMLLVFVLILLLTAGLTAAQDEPIRIGILTDQSGWLSVYGVEQQNGFELGLLYAAGVDPLEYDSLEDALAAVEVAGRPVEIIVYDYGSADAAADADNAAAGARELIESNFVDIIFGTPNSGAAIQVQQITSPDEFNLLFMAGPSASPSITGANFNPNTFRVCRNTNHDAAALTTVADQFGQTYIQIAVDTDFGRATAAAFQASLSAKGIEPVGDVLLVPTDVTDFTPFIQQIIDSGADFVNPILAGGPITLWTQQSEELGLTDAVLTLTGTNSNDFIVAAPPAPGSVAYIVYQYTLPKTEINDWLTDRHIQAFDDVPDLFTECGFATAQALVAGLEATGGDPSPEAMIPALEGLEFEGPRGAYTIREADHQVLMDQYVIRFMGVEDVQLRDDLTMTLPIYELFAEIPAADINLPCQLEGDYAARCG